MMKSVFCALVLCISTISIAEASDPLCGYKSLTVEFASEEGNKSKIYGTIDTPNSAYQYSLSFENDGVVLKGDLSLAQPADVMGATVITPLTINQQLEIPEGIEIIVIDVVKSFNWGPEYFRGDLMKDHQYICLSGDTYK